MSPQRLRRRLWCRRRLPLRKFPPIPDRPRAKSPYCSGCWEYPVPAELQARFLWHAISVLARRWAQPSLFPGLVEQVMVRELAKFRDQLEELEEDLRSYQREATSA